MVSMASMAQKHNLSVVFSSAPNDVYQNSDIIGGPDYAGVRSNVIGINYFYSLAKHFEFATGLEYSHSKFDIGPAPNPTLLPAPSHREQISMLSIPLGIRTSFLRYLFVYTGTSVDTDFSSGNNGASSMTGLGWNLGFGANFTYKNATAFFSPYVQQHGTISLAGEGDTREKLLLHGLKFGVGYRF